MRSHDSLVSCFAVQIGCAREYGWILRGHINTGEAVAVIVKWDMGVTYESDWRSFGF